MREVNVQEVTGALKDLSMSTNCILGEHEVDYLKKMLEVEESLTGKEIISMLIENADIARREMVPICQDTGFAVVFMEIGQDVHFTGGDLMEAASEGIRQGYEEGYLRKSIVGDCLNRVNTGDNTPPVVHIRIVPGDKVRIVLAPKGGGSENMSTFRVLKPAEGIEGVKDFVVQSMDQAGGNPCPPVVVGVGLGWTFERCARSAKEALLVPLGERNPDPFYRELEEDLLRRINGLGIGPQGLGGRVTALDVHVKAGPCHIASLPVAVNFNCHASRHGERVI
jgi:fumarate hydratase subunit alpha